MIYDCFPFFNEFELLNLRLHELDSVVDRFVLVEADTTHSGKPKEYLFNDRREFFGKWGHKIIAVKTSLPQNEPPHKREQHQRQMIWNAMLQIGAKPSDTILMSDVDEIPAAGAVANMLNFVYRGDIAFSQEIYQYYLNLKVGSNWLGTRMTRVGLIQEKNWDMHFFRHKVPTLVAEKSGWHFGFMGGAERVKKKIESYMHVEYDHPEFTDLSKITRRIEQGKDPFDRTVPLDDSCNKVVGLECMPAYVRENPEVFTQWLKPTI